MARTLSQIRAAINSKLQKAGMTLGTSDFNAGINLALDSLRMEIDIPQSKRTSLLNPYIFPGVTDGYEVPTDLYGDSITELLPVVEQPSGLYDAALDRLTETEFDRNTLWTSAEGNYTINYERGVRTLKFLGRFAGSVVNTSLNTCDTYDGNGTWTSYDDATNVHTDTTLFYTGSGSVAFDVDVSASVSDKATIYNADLNPLDISDVNQPYVFAYVYIPSITNLTSIEIVIGSDAVVTPATKANYKTYTATTQFNGQALQVGRNLIGIAESTAVSTGTPDFTAVQYLEVSANYSVAYTDQVNFRVDGIYYRQGQAFKVRYYSSQVVLASDGTTYKDYFTADDDVLILGPEAEKLFIDYATGYLCPNVKEETNGKTFADIAMVSLQSFALRYPSERRATKKNVYY